MSRLPRPYIPLSVRLEVAARQLCEKVGYRAGRIITELRGFSLRHQLDEILREVFGEQPVHLDHDPALENRTKVYAKGVHVDYAPAANDPNFLLYRIVPEHRIKTYVRGDGAQHSDAGLARKLKRMAKNREKRKSTKAKVGGKKSTVRTNKTRENYSGIIPRKSIRSRGFASDSRAKLRTPKRKWARRPFAKQGR